MTEFKNRIDSDLLVNSRTRAAVERISGQEMPPSLDDLVDGGQMDVSEALKILNANETRSWVLGWEWTLRDGFQEVFDNKGGH